MANKEAKKFSIERMYQNKEYFRQFIKELKEWDSLGYFNCKLREPSELLCRIDNLVCDGFGSDADEFTKRYISVDEENNKQLRLYGTYFKNDWGEQFLGYTRIVLD